MNKPWKLVLLLVGIFLAGGVTGAFVMLKVGHEMITRRPGPDQWAPNHVKRLVEKLGLNPEQTEQVRPIVRRNMDDLNRLRSTSMTETRAIFERMEREVSEKLTPEQREKYEQLNKEMRERFRKNADRPPGGPHPEREGGPGRTGEKPPAPADKPAPEKPPGT